ncbi:MAG: hypothetical protein ACYC67_12110 [Prosthecobacter sp.]
MKRLSFLTVLLFTTICRLHALEVPPGGMDVRGGSALEASASTAVGKAENLEQGKRIVITQPDAAKAYAAQFTAPVAEGIAKDERVLAIIKARVVGNAVSGEVQGRFRRSCSCVKHLTLRLATMPAWTFIVSGWSSR